MRHQKTKYIKQGVRLFQHIATLCCATVHSVSRLHHEVQVLPVRLILRHHALVRQSIPPQLLLPLALGAFKTKITRENQGTEGQGNRAEGGGGVRSFNRTERLLRLCLHIRVMPSKTGLMTWKKAEAAPSRNFQAAASMHHAQDKGANCGSGPSTGYPTYHTANRSFLVVVTVSCTAQQSVSTAACSVFRGVLCSCRASSHAYLGLESTP